MIFFDAIGGDSIDVLGSLSPPDGGDLGDERSLTLYGSDEIE
jgi:hypothetical protein